MSKKNTNESFWNKVDKSAPNGCWQWLGAKSGKGYAQFYINNSRVYVHRYSYELLVSKVPSGLVLDHRCRNRTCVNPNHMEVVTQQVNILRGIGAAAKVANVTHCPQGHEYTPENTYVYENRRYCRACGRKRTSDYEKRTKRWLKRSTLISG